MIVDCDAVDTYYLDISEKGAIVSVPIDNRIYGMRDFAVDDPDVNTTVFGQASDSSGF